MSDTNKVNAKLGESTLTVPAKTLNRGAEARPRPATSTGPGPAPGQRHFAFHLTTSIVFNHPLLNLEGD